MIEEILCETRSRKRSIVELCEHFGYRSSRAKFTNQNDFYSSGISNLVIPAATNILNHDTAFLISES